VSALIAATQGAVGLAAFLLLLALLIAYIHRLEAATGFFHLPGAGLRDCGLGELPAAGFLASTCILDAAGMHSRAAEA
jgi:hypothetical protein